MRKVLCLAFVMSFMMASVALAEIKIGVVDMQVIARDSAPAVDAKAKMDAKYGAEKKKLEAEAKTLQSKAEALQKSPTEKKQVEFVKLKRKFDEAQFTFTRKVEQDEVKIRQEMVTLVFEATRRISQAKGINYVVDITAGGVLYAEQSMDLTQAVLVEVNKLWKEGAAKAPEKK